MKKSLPVNLEKFRVNLSTYVKQKEGDIEGAYIIPHGNEKLRVIVSHGDGWDHVSVSLGHRTPTWNEINWVKNLFFDDDEAAIQIHPPKSQYVNACKTCLHLWRPQAQKIELPPRWMLVPDGWR